MRRRPVRSGSLSRPRRLLRTATTTLTRRPCTCSSCPRSTKWSSTSPGTGPTARETSSVPSPSTPRHCVRPASPPHANCRAASASASSWRRRPPRCSGCTRSPTFTSWSPALRPPWWPTRPRPLPPPSPRPRPPKRTRGVLSTPRTPCSRPSWLGSTQGSGQRSAGCAARCRWCRGRPVRASRPSSPPPASPASPPAPASSRARPPTRPSIL